MLLESLIPVVTCIRGMEEEDGVPLSYPYPAPTTARTHSSSPSPSTAMAVSSPLSSPFLLGQGQGQGVRQGQGQGVRLGQEQRQGQRQGDDGDSCDSSPRKTGIKMVRKFGRTSDPLVPSLEGTDVLTQVGGKKTRPGGEVLPSVPAYGASNVQSEGSLAASKWRAAVMASAAISSKVRDP